MDLLALKSEFVKNFGKKEENEIVVYFAPGRINLIGEHIDYNGGFVFPAAITFGTYAAVTARNDGRVALFSGNFKEDGIIEFDLDDVSRVADEPWSVYVKGVVDVFKKTGYDVKQGFNAYIEGNIPNGAGLSSSASLEVLIGVILADLNGFELSGVDNALLAQKAENEYVGVNCGIMDQFAIAMGKDAKAIKLNTDTLDYEYADCDLQDYRILIMNTNKRRELADSKYNERRAECDEALEILQKETKINYLCDLTTSKFDEISHVLTKENLLKRARHAVSENERVKDAVSALSTGNLGDFGKLLNASHNSLRYDYEVTGIELDTIVQLAQNESSTLGARMTGAGFGGCAIALVHKDSIDEVSNNIALAYKEKIGYEASFYIASIGDGARKL